VGGAPTARQEGSGDAVRTAAAGASCVKRLACLLSLSKKGDLGQLFLSAAGSLRMGVGLAPRFGQEVNRNFQGDQACRSSSVAFFTQRCLMRHELR